MLLLAQVPMEELVGVRLRPQVTLRVDSQTDKVVFTATGFKLGDEKLDSEFAGQPAE